MDAPRQAAVRRTPPAIRQPGGPAQPPPAPSPYRWVLAAASLLCAGILAAVWLRPFPSAVDVPELLARVRAADSELEQGGLHQVFRVELRELGSSPARRTSRVEVWSDRTGGRFSMRWEEEGRLRYGSWRPAAGGRAMFRLTARRTMRSLEAELTFEVDAETHWPRLYRIRFESPGRALGLVFSAAIMAPATTAELALARFEPDIPPPARPLRRPTEREPVV